MNDEQKWDDDIANLSLSDTEKNGLQVFRNYKNSFDNFSANELAKHLDSEEFDASTLQLVADTIVLEDARFIPVISCAFADNLLRDTFKTLVPDGVPGGKAQLLGPFGPFSDLSRRISLAFVFDLLSRDVLEHLDILRKVRNRISHSWDLSSLESFFTSEPINKLFAIETLLHQRPDWFAPPN